MKQGSEFSAGVLLLLFSLLALTAVLGQPAAGARHCGTLPSTVPLHCGQGLGAQLRAGTTGRDGGRREREVEKKSRLKAEN